MYFAEYKYFVEIKAKDNLALDWKGLNSNPLHVRQYEHEFYFTDERKHSFKDFLKTAARNFPCVRLADLLAQFVTQLRLPWK